MEKPIIILGANAIGRAAKEIFDRNNVVVYGFLDEKKEMQGEQLDNLTVLGTIDDEELFNLIGKKCDVFVALDENKVRQKMVKLIQETRKTQPINAIHTLAWVSPHASIGHGNFIDTGVHIAPGAKVGGHCIIHGRCFIGVKATLGDFVQLGIGSVVSPEVVIEEGAFIGAGVTIVSGITIGKGARVGAGSVVINHVKSGETVFGNPAQIVKG